MAMRGNYPSLMGGKSVRGDKKPPVSKPEKTKVVKAKMSDGAKFKASTGSMGMKKLFMEGCEGA